LYWNSSCFGIGHVGIGLVWLIVELLSIYNNGDPDIDNIECVCAAVHLYNSTEGGVALDTKVLRFLPQEKLWPHPYYSIQRNPEVKSVFRPSR
jgi:hypothetical protein